MKKLMHIAGARPQFVKLAPLYHGLSGKFEQMIVHTGQHYDVEMSDFFFRDLDIPEPDINLNVGSGHHGAQTGQMLVGIEDAVVKENPDLIIIYGDTNSTLAGSLVAAKQYIPCVHVEAGLRSFNREMPEEINRVIADRLSRFLFAPTDTAMKNLSHEGLAHNSYYTGDIMVDSLKEGLLRAQQKSDVMQRFKLEENSYNLLTLHRPYNVDDSQKLVFILHELEKMEEKIIFPVHPRTYAILEKQNHSLSHLLHINFTKPVGYLDMIMLESKARRILTDSGGIQKEAYILGKPCVTLRTETEWVETVTAGWNLLLPPLEEGFYRKIKAFSPPAQRKVIFGSDVAKTMCDIITHLQL